MIRTLLLAASALALTACATVETPAGPVQTTGPATQDNWDAGNTAYLAWNGGRPCNKAASINGFTRAQLCEPKFATTRRSSGTQ